MASSAVNAPGPATTTPTTADQRLSPKVRRLLREHSLAPGDVPGTGSRGRITPADVDRTARGADTRRPGSRRPGTAVLASPLARRLLRDAGLEPQDVTVPGPVTAAVARREVERTRTGSESDDATTIDLDIDLTRLLHGVGGLHESVLRRTGIELTPLAPLAHAVCRALRRHPAVHTPQQPDRQRDVALALVQSGQDGATTTLVACAQDLTVPALAARAARGRNGATGDGTPADATFALVGDGWGTTPPTDAVTDVPLRLTVDAATQRQVDGADEFGGATSATRWVATAHLVYDPARLDQDDADHFLADLRSELETVDLLAAVT